MLPARMGRKPRSRTSSTRSMITAGWSPAMSVMTTPAASARALRIGPRHESSSALIRTRCLPASIVRVATCAPNSTSPVASTMTSMPAASVRSDGVIGDHRPVSTGGGLDVGHRAGMPRVVHSGLPVGPLGLRDGPVGDGDDLDARDPADDPRREPAAGVAGSDQSDADRVARGGTRLQLSKQRAHTWVSGVKSGQAMSFSDTITSSVIGQAICRVGSFQRIPSSEPGTYGCDTW